MSDTLNRQRGFSLPEVMLAMVLMIIAISTSSSEKPRSLTDIDPPHRVRKA